MFIPVDDTNLANIVLGSCKFALVQHLNLKYWVDRASFRYFYLLSLFNENLLVL
jgi:hypothetical protein